MSMKKINQLTDRLIAACEAEGRAVMIVHCRQRGPEGATEIARLKHEMLEIAAGWRRRVVDDPEPCEAITAPELGGHDE
jgi:hypothetical protein